MKYNRKMTTREKVIKRQIDSIREYLISIQLESEYYEECIQKIREIVAQAENELKNLCIPDNGADGEDQREKELIKLIEDSKANIDAFTNLINEGKSTEKGLITKLNFYKRKREELTAKEFDNAVRTTPEKIRVNLDGVDFKEGPIK